MTIKQDIPLGWIASPLPPHELKWLHIAYKEIVTDWVWRNRHANPTITCIIRAEDEHRAVLCANYHRRLGAEEHARVTERDRLNALPQAETQLAHYRELLGGTPTKSMKRRTKQRINKLLSVYPELC
jgi:hypothetical protein